MEPVRRPFVASQRNLEVARARCATGGRKEAATMLGISAHTVRGHMKVLRDRLGLIDDSQVCYALAAELKALPPTTRDVAVVPPAATVAPPEAE